MRIGVPSHHGAAKPICARSKAKSPHYKTLPRSLSQAPQGNLSR